VVVFDGTCSGCSGFCPNFLIGQEGNRVRTCFLGGERHVQHVQAFAQTFSRVKKVDMWLFQDVQDVQAVQAFAQTSLRVKTVTRGKFMMFRMFRVFRLLPKLSQESKK
jgi:hypothetical protein